MRVTIKKCSFCGAARRELPRVNDDTCEGCREARIQAAKKHFLSDELPSQRVGKHLISGRRLNRVAKES